MLFKPAKGIINNYECIGQFGENFNTKPLLIPLNYPIYERVMTLNLFRFCFLSALFCSFQCRGLTWYDSFLRGKKYYYKIYLWFSLGKGLMTAVCLYTHTHTFYLCLYFLNFLQWQCINFFSKKTKNKKGTSVLGSGLCFLSLIYNKCRFWTRPSIAFSITRVFISFAHSVRVVRCLLNYLQWCYSNVIIICFL